MIMMIMMMILRLPDNFGELSNLKKLHPDYTNLQELPDSFSVYQS